MTQFRFKSPVAERASSELFPQPQLVFRHALLLALALFGVAAPAVRADSVALTPVADTFIAGSFPDKNFGAMAFFNGGTTQTYNTNRGLMRFDIAAAIPAGSKILDAALTTEVVGQPDEPWNSANFGLHRLLRDWGEGDNFGTKPSNAALAGTNEASWFYRFAFSAETWGAPGGQPGVDYVASPSVTTWIYEAGLPYSFNPTPALVADVQAWLNEPGTNFGWMLIVQNEADNFTARRFGSRESGIDAPRLDLTFQPPPPIDRIVMVNGLPNLSFTPLIGYVHQVQYRASLQTGAWQPLANVGPFTNLTQVVIVDAANVAQRFYRLILK